MGTIYQSSRSTSSCDQAFAVVNDIERYPDFLVGCLAATVLATGENHKIARLTLGRGRIRYSFTTRNDLHSPYSMDLSMVDGPFSHLQGRWLFSPQRDGCTITFTLDYAFSSALIALAGEPLIRAIGGTMPRAFVERCRQLHGEPCRPHSPTSDHLDW